MTHPDHARELSDLGVEYSFDVLAEAGAGFASDLMGRVRGPEGDELLEPGTWKPDADR